MQVSNNFMENVVFRDYNKEQEQSIHHSKVKHISDFVPDAVDILRNGEVHYGDTMPWTKTHDKFRFRSSEVTIWAGANGSGKSLVMGQVAIHLSKSTPVGIASFEMQPKKTVLRMLVQALPTNPSDQAIEQFNQELDIHIYDHVGNLDEDTVYGMCRYMAKEKGIKHIMIDSLVKCGINQSENEPQKRFMSKIQDIAKEYDIHIHVVMHLKKSEKETDRPDKNSIKGAGELVDLTDNALLIWRNKVKENLTSKQKRGEILTEKEVKTIEQPDCFIRVAKQRHGDYEDTLGFWFFLERQQWIDNNRGVYDRYIY